MTICWIAVMILLLTFTSPALSDSDNELESEEISVSFIAQGIGITELPAVIRNETVFLSVIDVFNFLKIKNNSSPAFDSVSGFFINQQDLYLIDKVHQQILFQNKVFDLKPDGLIRTETNLYMKSDYFGEVFGLYCTFNFRGLSVTLNTKLELPVIREMRQEQMRKNINHLKGETKADTVVGRSYPFFHFGTADWTINSIEQINGKNEVRLNLGFGGILAGGETNILLNYDNNEPFIERQQYFLWRFVNNDNTAYRQVMVGNISTQSISSIYSPVMGVQITNTPTTFRRSFGSYTLTDYTLPNWIVELYVNNVLTDYVKADASGFFTFEVPLVYGNSDIKLRYYGPLGEERTSLQNINIPYNFLPQNDFEYTVSAGTVEDSTNSLISRANFNYGVDRYITVGSGIEYYAAVTSGKSIPFVNASISLTSNLLFSGDYINGVRSRGIMNYRLPSNLQFEINYSKYVEGQKVINNNYLEDRKAMMSVPIHFGNSTLFSRFTVDQIILPTIKYTMADLLLSGSILGVSSNLTTYAQFTDPVHPYIYSNLSLTFRLPAEFVVTPQTQYDFNQKEFIFMKCEIEKRLFDHGYLDMIYERDFVGNINNFQIEMRYEFPFAQVSSSVRRDNNVTSLVQSATGSIMVDVETNYIGKNNRLTIDKGGIVLVPYLDLNCNGRHDKGEPKVPGLNFSINGGRIERDNRDTTVRILDLEPYATYTVEVNRSGFDNISWQIKKPVISVIINPNQFKLVEVPIAVVGEVSGTVYFSDVNGRKGQGRIIVGLYRSDSNFVANTLSESDGFFNYLGLAPGSYYARIDATQLHRLHMTSSPIALPFNINQNKDGDVMEGLEFVLQSILSDTSTVSLNEDEQKPNLAQKPPIVEKKVEQPSIKVKEEKSCIVKYNEKRKGYVLTISSWIKKSKALVVAKRAETMFGLKTNIEEAYIPTIGRRYRVYIGIFATREEAITFCQNHNFD